MYGADAVFVGGKEFSLRSSASNFTIEDIQEEAVNFANQYGAKIHVTCNIILHEENLEGIKQYLTTLDQIGVTAIIVGADPYIMALAKNKIQLELQVHVSTQLSSTNVEAVKFWRKRRD